MKARKIRSVKQSSFYGMLGGSLLFVIINFVIICVFVVTIAYLFVSGQEANLSQVLMNSLTDKQDRLVKVSKSISEVMASDSSESEKKLFLDKFTKNTKDISGVLILNEKGIITGSTDMYKDFIEMDFSGKDYFKEMTANVDYKIPSSNVSHRTKKVTLNVVTPIVKDNKLKGMTVVIVNPSIIENKALKGLEYYLVDKSGDIIFQSTEGNVFSKEDNIKSSVIMQEDSIDKQKALFYKDKVTGRYVLGIISQEPISKMYIVVQHHILSNTALLNGLIVLLAAALLFVLIFIVLFSAEVSSVVTNYVNILISEVRKISSGNYDIKLSSRYPHAEINEMMDSFTGMAHKVKQREEELQAYNEELVAANDEIKTMLAALSKSEKDKKEQYFQVIWTMVNLLEIKDEYTAGHSKSVTYYAEKIAEKLNIDYGFKLDIEQIQMAAILHDIGKIGISGEILNKPSRLTKEEYEIIKTHPSKGYYALRDIDSLKAERQIIKYHHERYDGLGYPEGLKGDNIPFGARIICVADAFDAMVSDRPYRKGLRVEAAAAELIKNKGIQFDPLIVDVFLTIVNKEDFNIHQNLA